MINLREARGFSCPGPVASSDHERFRVKNMLEMVRGLFHFGQLTVETTAKISWTYCCAAELRQVISKGLDITHSLCRGTQREHSSKPLKRSILRRILVFKR